MGRNARAFYSKARPIAPPRPADEVLREPDDRHKRLCQRCGCILETRLRHGHGGEDKGEKVWCLNHGQVRAWLIFDEDARLIVGQGSVEGGHMFDGRDDLVTWARRVCADALRFSGTTSSIIMRAELAWAKRLLDMVASVWR